MPRAITINAFGGPEVMEWTDVHLDAPGPGEVRVRHEAVGLNFIDVYHRTGLYPNPFPFTPGQEGAGIVTEVGVGVETIKPGDRVCYQGFLGAYCEERNVPAEVLIPLPDEISFDVAASCLLKGLTVTYLLEMTHRVGPEDVILFHAAAGGVGQIAVQWAKSLGAKVIGTVGSDDKAEIVKKLGADLVINLEKDDFVAGVKDFTDGRGVDVVYDSIGKNTFEASLDCLKPLGLMVSFGNSSGPVAVETLGILASKGSLFVTRPTLKHYFPTRDAERAGAAKLFAKIGSGDVKISIGQRYDLKDVGAAHTALEGRQTHGGTVLVP